MIFYVFHEEVSYNAGMTTTMMNLSWLASPFDHLQIDAFCSIFSGDFYSG